MDFVRRKLPDVMDLLINHHYLRRRTGDPMFVYTWEREGKAVACAVFVAPSNRYFGKGAVELSRLVRTDSVHLPMTQFLSLCFTAIRNDPRRIKFILSYADSTVGHHGGVYQAFNGIYVGTSKGHTLWCETATGRIVSNRAMDQHKNKDKTGWTRIKTGLKYLYVWPLHEKRKALLTRFGWSAQPYPKPGVVK